MFTGIIQAIGTIAALDTVGDALSMRVHAPGFFAQCRLGDSVAHNGVCLTMESLDEHTASFTLVRQTVVNTSFAKACVGDRVNLELACRPDSFMGGHYVMGHVDSPAVVRSLTPRVTGIEIDLDLPSSLRKYVIGRGSIALNGISLTVAEKLPDGIRVAIIPETMHHTNIADWKPGTLVNVEVDMIGKYVENYLHEAGIVPKMNA
jgi:riboflavin synthase